MMISSQNVSKSPDTTPNPTSHPKLPAPAMHKPQDPAAYHVPWTPCQYSKLNLLLALVGVGSSTRHHLAQLEFLGELAAQLAQLGHEGFGDPDDSFFGGERAVGLDAELDGGEEGVGNWGGVVSWVMYVVWERGGKYLCNQRR